jgi:hypothetical protein
LAVPRRRPEVLSGDQLHLRHPPGVAVDELIPAVTGGGGEALLRRCCAGAGRSLRLCFLLLPPLG